MDGRLPVQNCVTPACVVFGLSGFPSRKENGLISSRAPRERNRTIERSSEGQGPPAKARRLVNGVASHLSFTGLDLTSLSQG